MATEPTNNQHDESKSKGSFAQIIGSELETDVKAFVRFIIFQMDEIIKKLDKNADGIDKLDSKFGEKINELQKEINELRNSQNEINLDNIKEIAAIKNSVVQSNDSTPVDFNLSDLSKKGALNKLIKVGLNGILFPVLALIMLEIIYYLITGHEFLLLLLGELFKRMG